MCVVSCVVVVPNSAVHVCVGPLLGPSQCVDCRFWLNFTKGLGYSVGNIWVCCVAHHVFNKLRITATLIGDFNFSHSEVTC